MRRLLVQQITQASPASKRLEIRGATINQLFRNKFNLFVDLVNLAIPPKTKGDGYLFRSGEDDSPEHPDACQAWVGNDMCGITSLLVAQFMQQGMPKEHVTSRGSPGHAYLVSKDTQGEEILVDGAWKQHFTEDPNVTPADLHDHPPVLTCHPSEVSKYLAEIASRVISPYWERRRRFDIVFFEQIYREKDKPPVNLNLNNMVDGTEPLPKCPHLADVVNMLRQQKYENDPANSAAARRPGG